MYMVRHIWNCERGKAPECLEDIKAVNNEFVGDGNGSGKIYVDYSNRMDTIVWELEVESLDEYFSGQRAYYAGRLGPGLPGPLGHLLGPPSPIPRPLMDRGRAAGVLLDTPNS